MARPESNGDVASHLFFLETGGNGWKRVGTGGNGWERVGAGGNGWGEAIPIEIESLNHFPGR